MKTFIPFVAMLVGLSIPQIASACSCATGDAAQEFNRVTGVFIGKMMGGTEKFADGSGGELEAEKYIKVEQSSRKLQARLPLTSMPAGKAAVITVLAWRDIQIWAYENKERKVLLHRRLYPTRIDEGTREAT